MGNLPRVLMVVRNGHVAELVRQAMHMTGAERLDIFPVGAALGARRYDRIIVVSRPEDFHSQAERDACLEWQSHLSIHLAPGEKVIFAT